jgi:hypothetical protein
MLNQNMKATIYSHKQLIGTANLQIEDESMGCVFGEFIPNDNYLKHIQKTVWEFGTTDKPDYTKWNSLRFNVQLDNGLFLFPIGGYTFDDSPDFPDEPKRIDIAGIDLDIFNLEEHFLLDPWNKINVEQKIDLENELQKEIGINKSFFGFISTKRNHVLTDTTFSALASFGPSDDCLFAISKNGNENKYAVVHLTWKGSKDEFDKFPSTYFYKDIADFHEDRVKPDSEEYD